MNPHLVLHRLTVTQAAELSNRHRSTVYKALENGELHGTQRVAGGRWSIRPECLEAWVDAQPCTHVQPQARSA